MIVGESIAETTENGLGDRNPLMLNPILPLIYTNQLREARDNSTFFEKSYGCIESLISPFPYILPLKASPLHHMEPVMVLLHPDFGALKTRLT